MNTLCMPMVGTEISLGKDTIFSVQKECRNAQFIQNYREAVGLESDEYLTSVSLPKGTVLKVDRIYLRKGAGDFDSMTFILVSNPKVKKLKGRFFVSMDQLQGLRFDFVKSDDINAMSAKDFVKSIDKVARKQYMIDNKTSNRWLADTTVAEKVMTEYHSLPKLASYTLSINVSEKIRAFIDALEVSDIDELADDDEIDILGKSLKVKLVKAYKPLLKTQLTYLEQKAINEAPSCFDENNDIISYLAGIEVRQINEDTIYDIELYRESKIDRIIEKLDDELRLLAMQHGHHYGYYYPHKNRISIFEHETVLSRHSFSTLCNSCSLVDHKNLLKLSVDEVMKGVATYLVNSENLNVPSLKKDLIRIRKSIKS